MWKNSKKFTRAFKRELSVYHRILADDRTPRRAKIFLGLAVGYLCMPLDVIPDFIPIIGHLDDAVIVPGLIYLALRSIPSAAKQRSQKIRAGR